MNQSKLEVITRGWREARENECEQLTFSFVLLLIGWKKARFLLRQSCSVVMQNQLPFEMKTAPFVSTILRLISAKAKLIYGTSMLDIVMPLMDSKLMCCS